MDTLYSRIKKRREDLGMSQLELACALGYTDRSSIAKIEKGVNDITQSKIVAFADALHTTPAYLMGWTDDYYDYDLDEDNRTEEIPIAIHETLMKAHNDDFQQVWYAWLRMNEECPPCCRQPIDFSSNYNSSLKMHDERFACYDDTCGRNVIRIAGRNGSYEERVLSDEQLSALKAIIAQMPDASDDL